MNKNEEIRELMEKLLPLCTLADKHFLIGLLNGIMWKQKKEQFLIDRYGAERIDEYLCL